MGSHSTTRATTTAATVRIMMSDKNKNVLNFRFGICDPSLDEFASPEPPLWISISFTLSQKNEWKLKMLSPRLERGRVRSGVSVQWQVGWGGGG